MSRALVLNATYEPLCVVPSRRAAVLVLGQRAEVLHDTGELLRSERLALCVPSVIRLRAYVKVPYRRRAPLNRRGIFARDGHRCQYCGAAAESIDHVVPRSKGGPHEWENVVAACRPCNVRKRDRLLPETTMALRQRPSAPREMTWVVVAVGTVPAALGALPAARGALRLTGAPTDERWAVEHRAESAAAFHARTLDDAGRRAVWVCQPSSPALVLGSTQPDAVVDTAACAAAGVDVVRRRSGGGAVLVEPGALLWVDVIVPAGDALWDADVGRSFLWLGDVWAGALAELGIAATVHRGALRRSRWSDLVCFAGLGPGEVTRADGAKVVGISQRRTRACARFQCAALARWAPGRPGRSSSPSTLPAAPRPPPSSTPSPPAPTSTSTTCSRPCSVACPERRLRRHRRGAPSLAARAKQSGGRRPRAWIEPSQARQRRPHGGRSWLICDG